VFVVSVVVCRRRLSTMAIVLLAGCPSVRRSFAVFFLPRPESDRCSQSTIFSSLVRRFLRPPPAASSRTRSSSQEHSAPPPSLLPFTKPHHLKYSQLPHLFVRVSWPRRCSLLRTDATTTVQYYSVVAFLQQHVTALLYHTSSLAASIYCTVLYLRVIQYCCDLQTFFGALRILVQ